MCLKAKVRPLRRQSSMVGPGTAATYYAAWHLQLTRLTRLTKLAWARRPATVQHRPLARRSHIMRRLGSPAGDSLEQIRRPGDQRYDAAGHNPW